MAIDQTQPTRLGTLSLGGAAGLLAATVLTVGHALIGSLFLPGNVIQTSVTGNVTPSLVYDSGSYLTYTKTQFNLSGSTNYAVATIQSPQTFFSGAVLQRVQTSCGNRPNLVVAQLGISPRSKTTATGTLVLQRNLNLFSGSLIGSATGQTIRVQDGNYLVLLGNSGSNIAVGNGECFLQAWWNEKLGNR